MKLFAVIPTVGERNDTLIPMLNRLSTDGVIAIVVDNGREGLFPGVSPRHGLVPEAFPYLVEHRWLGEPVNLSKLWNMGLNAAENLAGGEEFTVAVFNDDLTLPPGLVQAFADKLQREGSSAVYAHSYTDLPNMTNHDPWHLGNRMVGFAFALRGSDGLRADEDLLWWWGDSDLDWRARQKRGVCALGVPTLQHHDPNGYTNRNPELTAQAGRDRETFYRKWGFLPW